MLYSRSGFHPLCACHHPFISLNVSIAGGDVMGAYSVDATKFDAAANKA